MESNKTILKNKINELRFLPIDESFFTMTDEYNKLCRQDSDTDEEAASYFYKGEAFFRLGNYTACLELMNTCLSINKSFAYKKYNAMCLNLMGLIYAFLGYESTALENYLEAKDIAYDINDWHVLTCIYMNIGCMYRDLDNYSRAVEYFKKALVRISSHSDIKYPYHMEVLCRTYLGQIYCKQGNYHKAITSIGYIETQLKNHPSFFYKPAVNDLRIRICAYLGDDKMLKVHLNTILSSAAAGEDFLEFLEFYLNTAEFIISQGMKKEAGQLLSILRKNQEEFHLISGLIKIHKIELLYLEAFGDEITYLKSCRDFVKLTKEYEKEINGSKIEGLNHIEQFKKVCNEKSRLEELNKQDMMTGLLNKNTAEYLIKDYIDSHRKTNLLSILIIIDLDNFKHINDTFGHLEGDRVIVNAARIIHAVFEDAYAAGRIGGDEFLVFMTEEVNLGLLQTKVELFQSRLHHSRFGPDGSYAVTASMGIGILSGEIKDTYESLFERADQALYRAKKDGRNTSHVY